MTSTAQLLMLPSDTYKEDTLSYTAIEKSGASKSFHPNGTPTSRRDNSPLINGQLSNVSSETSSLHSSGQFEFEDLPGWTALPDGGSVTSLDISDDELHRVNNDVDSGVDEVPRKRQKTQTGSITVNARITTNVRVKSRDEISTILDGGSRKRKHSFATPAVDSVDTRVIHEAIPNTESSPTTTISSHVQIEKSNSTVIRTKPALSRNPSVEEGNSTPISSRKKTNGLSGLLVSRPLAMSKSTSDSLNSGVLSEDRDEPPRKTRGLALRPTNRSHGTKLKKSQYRIANQDELESWTNADIAHIRFRKPDEQKVLDEVEEENTRRNVSHILKSLTDIEAESSNENVARNERTISKSVLAMPDSSIYTRCDDLVGEIFGRNNRNRGMKPKTGLVKAKQALEKIGEKRTDMTIWYDMAGDDVKEVDEEEDAPEKGESEVDELMVLDEPKFLENPSKALEWTKTIKNIQAVDGVGVSITSDIEREKAEITLRKHYSSIDEGQEDEETRDDVNSPQVPLPHLEDWSTTLRSLIKGKKRFQHQDLIDLKNTLQEIYNNRAKISATSSLAQEVYEVSQLEVQDVPNQDELRLRALARKSTRYWGIGKPKS